MEKLKEKIRESLSSTLPITLIVLLLSMTYAPMEIGIIAMFLVGAALLIVGMGIFQLGAEITMTPFGNGMGSYLAKKNKMWLVVISVFIMGALITIAEPDLSVLANQVASIPNIVLILTVAVGVGLFIVLSVLRTRFGISLSTVLLILYALLFGLSAFAPSTFTAVAFDAGGVTTGPMTVPFIMAMGIGLAAVAKGKKDESDSFGLIALCSIGPIIMVMLLGIIYNPSEATYNAQEIAPVVTTKDIVSHIAENIPQYLYEVGLSILPVAALLVIFQLITRTYRVRELQKLVIGLIYTYIGLVMFLTGVNIGFAPVGTLLGTQIASSSMKWALVPIGMLIGYFIVKAEPAVQVLNEMVEELTGGTVSRKMMGLAMSASISIAVALSVIRVLCGFSIYWYVIPGYIIAIVLSRLVPPIFVGIAFDSGGVASGPMTSTFLLPLSIGICLAVGGNIVTDAFGIVAMVAMAPLISIQLMGLIYKYKSRKRVSHITKEQDVIIDLEVNV